MLLHFHLNNCKIPPPFQTKTKEIRFGGLAEKASFCLIIPDEVIEFCKTS